MHVIVWEFEARPGKETEFEKAYGAHGDWALLFSNSPDYCGTDLLKSITTRTYLTIDRWTSAAAFADFKQQWQAEYQTLDQQMESVTHSERSIGQYESA
ncbi:MAG TPA: antibiotic biosynthesis monooxygenase [Gemmatimonadales bacterium]|nr:antibiotic biosynthesis monooxygenase [Gemmatimonadales bacterium]